MGFARYVKPGPSRAWHTQPAMTTHDADRVYVLGAGHGGCITALTLVEAGIPVTLIDKEAVVSQGPACHLHAFGGIYPDMPNLESLPEHAISFGLAFPQAVDLRPTLVVLAAAAPWSPSAWHKRLSAGASKYGTLLDELEPTQRRALVPDGAPILEVLRTSVGSAPRNLSPWGIRAKAWLPGEARDAVLLWEAGINCIRLAGMLERALATAGPLFELRLQTAVTSLEPHKHNEDCNVHADSSATQHSRWRLELESAEGETFSVLAAAVIDARGAKSAANAPAEFKCVFWAQHDTAPNEPEVVVLDRRGSPGLTQYTPGAFGSRLHKMQVGASLFNAISPGAPSEPTAAALHRQASSPLRCLDTYELARPVLRPGTLPPPAAIRPLPTVAQFQRLAGSGSTEARSSEATERGPGLIDLMLSKTVSAPAVAAAALALVRARLPAFQVACAESSPGRELEPSSESGPGPEIAGWKGSGSAEETGAGPGGTLRRVAMLSEEEVRAAAEGVCTRRGLPLSAALKYDWTVTRAPHCDARLDPQTASHGPGRRACSDTAVARFQVEMAAPGPILVPVDEEAARRGVLPVGVAS